MPLDLSEARKEQLIEVMSAELAVLRAKADISQEELSKSIGVSRQTVQTIEAGKRKMTWRTYLALLLFFDYNALTHDMLRNLNVFPKEFQDAKQLLSQPQNAASEACR